MARADGKFGKGKSASARNWHAFGAPSNYVVISFSSAEQSPRIQTVEVAERVGRTLGNEAMMLVDTSEQIQAIFQERWLAATELPKDVDLYAFVLTPGLAERVAPERPARRGGGGLFELDPKSLAIDVRREVTFEKVFRQIKAKLARSRAPAAAAASAGPKAADAVLSNEGDVAELIGLRKRLREDVPMVDSEQWGQWRGVSTNPSATLAKYREQGRLFAVKEGRTYLYPRFQFGPDAAPLDAIADVLKAVPEDARGWPLLSWFDARSTLLGRQKPRDVIAQNPSAVIQAAKDFYSDD